MNNSLIYVKKSYFYRLIKGYFRYILEFTQRQVEAEKPSTE